MRFCSSLPTQVRLTRVDDVRRLLKCEHIAPTWLLLGEFSRAQATQLETRRGVAVLTVDRRPPLGPGLAYQGEFQDVLHLSLWEGVFTWASCTHQAVADELCCDDKALDGRMFWGIPPPRPMRFRRGTWLS